MQYVDLWRIEGDSYITIRQQVLETFAKYIQHDSEPESGGILLGYVKGPHMEVVEATEPMGTDKRRRFFFLRNPKGHQDIANQRWEESGGLIRYLGEWHTHPQDTPFPSCLDRSEWRRSAKRRSDERPQLGLIVGRTGLFLELAQRDGSLVRCQEAID